MDLALLILRLGAGLTLAAHGSQKLFGAFGGPGTEGFAGFLKSMGLRPARALAWLTGLGEFLGGLFLAMGFLTPLAAAVVIGVMLTATLMVHADNGFFAASGGYEFPLLIAVCAAAIAVAGPGRFSFDATLRLPINGSGWGLAAVALGVGAALLAALAQRVQSRRGSGGMRAA